MAPKRKGRAHVIKTERSKSEVNQTLEAFMNRSDDASATDSDSDKDKADIKSKNKTKSTVPKPENTNIGTGRRLRSAAAAAAVGSGSASAFASTRASAAAAPKINPNAASALIIGGPIGGQDQNAPINESRETPEQQAHPAPSPQQKSPLAALKPASSISGRGGSRQDRPEPIKVPQSASSWFRKAATALSPATVQAPVKASSIVQSPKETGEKTRRVTFEKSVPKKSEPLPDLPTATSEYLPSASPETPDSPFDGRAGTPDSLFGNSPEPSPKAAPEAAPQEAQKAVRFAVPDVVQKVVREAPAKVPQPELSSPLVAPTTELASPTAKVTIYDEPEHGPVPVPKSPVKPRPGQLPTPQPESETTKDEDDMSSNFIEPKNYRHMRACMVCSIIRTYQQFLRDGCPNCEEFLNLQGDGDQIGSCTSQVFEGTITVAVPSRSWIARYQRIDQYVPGVYALQVEGLLPDDVVVAAENAGIAYLPRDGSSNAAIPTEG